MELKNFFAVDVNGNVLAGATCYLYQRGTTILVAGLQDAEGDPLSNPFTTNSDGLAQFAAQNGEYDLYITSTIRQYTIPVKCIDFSEQLDAAELAAERSESARDAALAAAAAAQAYSRPAVVVINADRTISVDDEGKYLRTVGNRTLPIATHAAAQWPLHARLHFRVGGAGTVTLVAPVGGTLVPPAGGTLSMTYAMSVTLIRVAAAGSDVWDVIGQTVPAS